MKIFRPFQRVSNTSGRKIKRIYTITGKKGNKESEDQKITKTKNDKKGTKLTKKKPELFSSINSEETFLFYKSLTFLDDNESKTKQILEIEDITPKFLHFWNDPKI